MKKATILSVCLLFSVFNMLSQNLDSLMIVAQHTKNDSVKIRLYNKIGSAYIFNDTKKALQVITEGEQLAKEKNFLFGLTELTNTHGIYMDVTGKSDSANYYFSKALQMSKTYHFKTIENMCLNNLGMFHWNKSNFNEALNYFFQSLKMVEALGNEKGTATPLNNIGLIYQEMNLNAKALEYHQKSLKIREKFNLKNEQIASLNNIGICYKSLGKLKAAISTYQKGIELAKQTNNLIDYYRLLDNLANAYQEGGNYDKAIETYQLALERPKDYDADKKGYISIYTNLTAIYNSLNNPSQGLFYANKAFGLIQKYPHLKDNTNELYLKAAESQYMLNNFEAARILTEKYVILKDSVFSEQNAKAVADLEVKYDTEKKEKQILIQRAELAEHKLTIQKQSYKLYAALAFALILGLIGYLFYNQQKLKNKQLLKENELKDALLKIETQSRLQEQRLNISRDLHDTIGAQLTFIISSIDNLKYGFDIKDKKLTDKLDSISNFTSATIYELRDTIWAMNKNEITFDDLQSRISNFIDKAHVIDDDTTFSFNVSNDISTAKTFSSVEGMNIHRIIQEAIHNSLKHANPTEIKVQVSRNFNILQFEVSDNGTGFDINLVKRGNGINNMQKRAHEISGELVITSLPVKGTVVCLSIPA
ncbi:MAG: tetratricopeptide repeat protein [Gelidibacter sp.]|nr:tetratricopeptide repeat protein [Gelidibacter sp.]